jgi:hypothetical protein
MIKRKRNYFLILVAAFAVILLFFVLTVTPSTQKHKGPQKIVMPYNLNFTIPADWKVFKKLLDNQIIFTNNGAGDNACYLDVFVVRPDREYGFKQWLGTAIANQTFLQTGKETTYKNKDMYIGSYKFVDDYFKVPVNNQRAMLKGRGTLADLHMSYKNNASCTKDFRQILDSVNF